MRTPGVLAVLLLVGSTTFASAQGPAPADRPDPVPVSIALGLEEAFAAHRIVAQRCLVWGDRLDRVVAEVVERDVLRRNERALLLAGEWKLDRRRRPANPGGYGLDSAARRIEQRHPGSLFVAWALRICRSDDSNADELIASWRAPTIARIGGTSVGEAPETLIWGCRKRFGLRGLPLAKPRADRPLEPDADLYLVCRADRPGDQPPEVDLVDLLGLQKVRQQEQGLRLQLQVDHAPLNRETPGSPVRMA